MLRLEECAGELILREALPVSQTARFLTARLQTSRLMRIFADLAFMDQERLV